MDEVSPGAACCLDLCWIWHGAFFLADLQQKRIWQWSCQSVNQSISPHLFQTEVHS